MSYENRFGEFHRFPWIAFHHLRTVAEQQACHLELTAKSGQCNFETVIESKGYPTQRQGQDLLVIDRVAKWSVWTKCKEHCQYREQNHIWDEQPLKSTAEWFRNC